MIACVIPDTLPASESVKSEIPLSSPNDLY